MVGGLLTVGLIGFAVLSSPQIRPKLMAAAQRARARFDEMRAEPVDVDVDVPGVATPVGLPIDPDAFMEPAPAGIDGVPTTPSEATRTSESIVATEVSAEADPLVDVEPVRTT